MERTSFMTQVSAPAGTISWMRLCVIPATQLLMIPAEHHCVAKVQLPKLTVEIALQQRGILGENLEVVIEPCGISDIQGLPVFLPGLFKTVRQLAQNGVERFVGQSVFLPKR